MALLMFILYVVVSLFVFGVAIYFRKRCVILSIVLISLDVVILVLNLLKIRGLI